MRDYTGSFEQRRAMKVPCRDCAAAVGSPCVRDGNKPLTVFPAHASRTRDAQRAFPSDWHDVNAVDLDSPPRRDFSEPLHEPSEGGR